MKTVILAAIAATALTATAIAAEKANPLTLTAKKTVGIKTAQNTAQPVQTKTGKRSAKSPASVQPAIAPAVTTTADQAIEPKLQNRSFSENAFHIGEGQKAVTVSPRYYKSDRSYTVSGAKVNETYLYNTIDITYARAFGPDWVGSVGGYIGNAEVSSGAEGYRDTGLSDFTFKAQKLETTDDGQMFRGGFVSLSPGDRQMGYDWSTPTAKKSSNGNLYSGGHSFGGYVGKQYVTPEKIYGVRGTGQYYMDRKANKGSASGDLAFEQGGGHTIAGEAFAEFPQRKPMYLGVKGGLTYIMGSDINLKAAGTSTNYDSDPRQILNLGAYGRINYSDSVTILPAVQINKQLNSASGKWSYEGQDDFALNVAARIAL